VFGNLYDNTGARTSNALINLRNLGAFDKYFCYCREIDNMFFKNSNQIVAKCIAHRIDAMNYCLSELIDEQFILRKIFFFHLHYKNFLKLKKYNGIRPAAEHTPNIQSNFGHKILY